MNLCLKCLSRRCEHVIPPGHLTPVQAGVLLLVGKGMTNREIALERKTTVGTIKIYLNRIYPAIGARNRAQAAVWASQHAELLAAAAEI